MSANQAAFPIALMARVLADAALLKRVRTIHARSRETHGAPRVHAELRAGGEKHGRKRIARLMRAAGLVGASRRRTGGVTARRRDQNARPAPALVDRGFAAAAPNQLWVADITFVPTASGFRYLAVVLEAWSRKVAGWSMANHLRAELVLDALEMASGQRRPDGVIHRSDQGGAGQGSACAARGMAAEGANARRWRSASAAGRPASGRPGDASATPMTTPCAKASSPPSNASCWTAVGSRPRRRRREPASASSKAGTTRSGGTLPSAPGRPWTAKQQWRLPAQTPDHPSPHHPTKTGQLHSLTVSFLPEHPTYAG